MTPEQIDRLRKLLDKATPGPWVARPHPDEDTARAFWYIYSAQGGIIIEVDGETEFLANTVGTLSRPDLVRNNAALIAESRNALPDLLATLATRDAEIARLNRLVKAIQRSTP